MTLPAKLFVQVIPGVVSAGGDALDLNGLAITKSVRVPIGKVYSFATAAAVAAFFGASSLEARIAGGGTDPVSGVSLGSGYFGGYTNSLALPGALLFAQYPATAVAAYLQGGNISTLALTALQALSGSLTVVVDGYAHVISSISLASYNSFSAAAAGIAAAFTDPTESSFTASLGSAFTATGTGTSFAVTSVTGYLSVGDTVTGTGVPASTTIIAQVSGPAGGAGTYTTSVVTTAGAASCTAVSSVLDVTVCASPTIAVGQTLVGAGVTGTPLITSQISGTAGGIGLYRISGVQQHVASEAMTGIATVPLVTYDSVSGAFIITSGVTGVASTMAYATGTLAIPLLLTAATGAVLSQGAAATDPATFMTGIVAITTNWATFLTGFDPDNGSGNVQKQAFAAWKNGQNNRFAYVCWDTDITATQQVPASTSLGQILKGNGDSGTLLIYQPSDYGLAAFGAGYAASLDFTATNGRTTLAYRSQAGLTPSVTDQTSAVNLGGNPQSAGDFGNGYNYYCDIATPNQDFIGFQRGTVTGPFQWFDSYINQIWLNNAFQLALMELLTNTRSIPYNAAGNALIEAALADPINAGLNFGAFRAGVALSAAQIAEVNADAGANIATTLQNRGWYLQIGTATAQVRQNRGSPPMTFWYIDGESVQSFSLASILVQ